MTEQEEQAPLYQRHTGPWQVECDKHENEEGRRVLPNGDALWLCNGRWGGGGGGERGGMGIWIDLLLFGYAFLTVISIRWSFFCFLSGGKGGGSVCIDTRVARDLSYWRGGFTEAAGRTMAVYPSGSWSLSSTGQLSCGEEGEHVPHRWPCSGPGTARVGGRGGNQWYREEGCQAVGPRVKRITQ